MKMYDLKGQSEILSQLMKRLKLVRINPLQVSKHPAVNSKDNVLETCNN